MIKASVLNHVRAATCALGYLTIPIKDFLADQTQPAFEVLGTGFAVRTNLVMTNRHVVQAIEKRLLRGISEDKFVAMFVYEDKHGHLVGGIGRMLTRGAVMNPDWDIGFIGIQPKDAPEITPLVPIDPWRVSVSEEVAACGYPYGTQMLRRDTGKLYRWGPIVQQGYISAVAPYDTADKPTELLLDLRAAGGMSGSPVFRPSDGGLLGIIYATAEATTALALPIRKVRLEELLRVRDKADAKVTT